MTWRFRTVLGFVVAPLTPAYLLTAMAMLGGGPLGGLAIGFYAFMPNAFFGYPFALVVGVPIYLVCQRRRWDHVALYACAGLTLGGVPGLGQSARVIGRGEPLASSDLMQALLLMAIGAAFGALSTTFFWLIVRPDRARQRPSSER